jgi:UDP-N-acetyl-D-mannosaminuronic acid dehydrogenase
LYGLTYKEDVDDVRQSPTLQLLESMQKHLAFGIKVYDPLISKQIVENQYFDFDFFLNDIEIFVIMVAHTHIKQNFDRLKEKFVLDTKNICPFENTYKL